MDQPQLRMIHRLATIPPLRALPEGYLLRVATTDDSNQLASLLAEAYGEPWTQNRVNDVLLMHRDVPTTYVIETNQLIVATASYQVMPEQFPESGWVHYVGASSAHTGKGLGYSVTRAVLQRVSEEGHRNAMLTTDDFRLPAIHTYLKLGFEPDLWHESHPYRWKQILKEPQAK